MPMASPRLRPVAAELALRAAAPPSQPPVVVHGDYSISQSVAASMYVGQKLGLGLPDGVSVAKAVQYMNDLADLTSEAGKAALADEGRGIRAFIEGGRFEAWLANIENSIAGPYYFGFAPSYVDFFCLGVFDWAIDDSFLSMLTPKLFNRSIDVYGPYPKLCALLRTLRAQPWYHTERPYPINVNFERLSPAALAAYDSVGD